MKLCVIGAGLSGLVTIKELKENVAIVSSRSLSHRLTHSCCYRVCRWLSAQSRSPWLFHAQRVLADEHKAGRGVSYVNGLVFIVKR
jgi:hypothetical protein